MNLFMMKNLTVKAIRTAWAYRPFGDFHQNVFTPASFELLIYELWEYELIDLKIATLYDTTAEEFIVSMHKAKQRPVLNSKERMELIRRVSHENVVD